MPQHEREALPPSLVISGSAEERPKKLAAYLARQADVKRRQIIAETDELLPGERERHGTLVAVASIPTEDDTALPGVKMHRVQSPVERYAMRGSLTIRQSSAANDLREDWEFGIVGACDTARRGTGGGPAGMTDAQLDAATAYRKAVEAMGKSVSAIVLPVVIGDAAGGEITVETLAIRRDEDRKQVMGMLKLGLDRLADHYALCADRLRAAKYA